MAVERGDVVKVGALLIDATGEINLAVGVGDHHAAGGNFHFGGILPDDGIN
ncbi:hypothetical protein SDC9_144865 [bioreactor metagenome]|uniref:Uncharacterized protein n=1 Tax=bioreactor metagenome TaxID=1076179 RepID=A0A645E975_9ZZZZ